MTFAFSGFGIFRAISNRRLYRHSTRDHLRSLGEFETSVCVGNMRNGARSVSTFAKDIRSGTRKTFEQVLPDLDRSLMTLATKGKVPGWNAWPVDGPDPTIAPFDAAQAKTLHEA